MDDLIRQRRHNYPLGNHAASTSRLTSQPSRPIINTSTDRYRQTSTLNTSPQTPRSIGSIGSAGPHSNFYHQEPPSAFSSTSSMPPANLGPYGSDYGQDGRQPSQGFGGYNTASLMDSVGQPNTQTSVYDAQQFGARQPPALQLMTPDVTSTYFSADGAAAAPSSLHQSASLNYASNMQGVNAIHQAQGAADISMNEEPDFTDNSLEDKEKWHNYQRQLAVVFQEITEGSLDIAAETLLSLSNWLLPQAVDLGLTIDDSTLHTDRIKLWDEFNYAWMALAQKQLDIIQSSQEEPRLQQKPLSLEIVKKLGSELVRLCDPLERHGLVDYQYGVREEQITQLFIECVDLLEADDQGTSSR